MPINLEPNQTFKVTLKADEEKADGKPIPAFIVRYLNMRECQKLCELHDQLHTTTKVADVFKISHEMMTLAVSGWENMGNWGEYTPEKLADLMTFGESAELSRKIIEGNKLSAEARGN